MSNTLKPKSIRNPLHYFSTFLVFLFLTLLASQAWALEKRPFRGAIGVSVLLCKYKGAPTPAKSRSYYENLAIKAGTGAHADFWKDVSFGGITLKGSVVKGWYTLDKTAEQSKAYGGGGSNQRIKKFTDCRDKAKQKGYTPPSNHIVIVITSPGIDTFGFSGGAFLGEDANVGVMSHEVAHGLSLSHSFSDDPNYKNASWSAIGEYDDQWDTMSYANVFSKNTGSYGNGGPGLNAYHRDRQGWLKRNKIFRFGADGKTVKTVTLTALNKPNGSGYQMVRIPFDVNDRYRYYTVEYRVKKGWDSGIPNDVVLIHEVKERSNGNYVSYLLRGHSGTRAPKESINRNGVKIEVISKTPGSNRAVVKITSNKVIRCVKGYVWREARPSDKVCVSVARRSQVKKENQLAASRKQPGGGKYGPDTCKKGYVWREAYQGDHVCVGVNSRTTAKKENQIAFERRLGGAAYGPNTCKSGYVWREADQSDWVCVTAKRRSEVKKENSLASSRRKPGGGAYGPDTCKQGFVWREAFPKDRVCVRVKSRSTVREENKKANSRLAKKGA